MNNEFSLKELYDVRLKATYPIEIGNCKFAPGETIAFFDKLTLANFQEIQQVASAKGGYGNQGKVFWTTTKEVQLVFHQGIFSRTQFALMTNAKLLKFSSEAIPISCRETHDIEIGGDCKIELRQEPLNLFCYDENYQAISPKSCTGRFVVFNQEDEGKTVIIDYEYNYTNGHQKATIGRELISGFISLEGKTRVKDDITGQTKTGIIKIPKLKIMSSLSMVLGTNANPVVGSFQAIGLPVGAKGNTTVMEIDFLNDDIDADIE